MSAVIGAAILVVLYLYGMEYGTWLDEAGPLAVAPPSFLLPFVLGALGLVLFVGGLVLTLAGPGSPADSDDEG
ncbi:hypothetical protein ACFDTO_29090 [Microbacteriaceae bacterium 4G12]